MKRFSPRLAPIAPIAPIARISCSGDDTSSTAKGTDISQAACRMKRIFTTEFTESAELG